MGQLMDISANPHGLSYDLTDSYVTPCVSLKIKGTLGRLGLRKKRSSKEMKEGQSAKEKQ